MAAYVDTTYVYIIPYFVRYIVILLAMSIFVGIFCNLLDGPSNGSVSPRTGNFGDVAKYSCDTGYTLNGPAERTCQADGQWNGSVPTCKGEMLQCSNQLCCSAYVCVNSVLLCVLV